MRRQLLSLFALAALVVCVPMNSAHAIGGGHGHGGHGGHGGLGRGGFGLGLGIGGGGYGWDIAELYRELYHNLPYFALHPPVYYSEPVPRTYGYSPFAYPPGTMTPDVSYAPEPVTISNPYAPATPVTVPSEMKPTDRSASASQEPQPLVIINPFVSPASRVATVGYKAE